MSAEEAARSKRLFSVLSGLLRHRPLVILNSVTDRNGYEVWRLLTSVFASRRKARGLAILSTLMQYPSFTKDRALREQISALERLAQEYQLVAKKEVQDDLMLGTLIKALTSVTRFSSRSPRLPLTVTSRTACLRLRWFQQHGAIRRFSKSSVCLEPIRIRKGLDTKALPRWRSMPSSTRVGKGKEKGKGKGSEHGNKLVDGRLAVAKEKTARKVARAKTRARRAKARARATAPNASIVANLATGRGTADSSRQIERTGSDLSLRVQRRRGKHFFTHLDLLLFLRLLRQPCQVLCPKLQPAPALRIEPQPAQQLRPARGCRGPPSACSHRCPLHPQLVQGLCLISQSKPGFMRVTCVPCSAALP